MDKPLVLPDGLEELLDEMPGITHLIARTARWVHPDTFHALPVWYPEAARGTPSYKAGWTERSTNTSKLTGQTVDRHEPNILAGKALVGALGLRRKPKNWTVCHVWGVDDPSFQRTNRVVRDPRFYSCVANMVFLPTPLKGFTDAVPELKLMLRTCVYHLYGWVCEHSDVADQTDAIRAGTIPNGYPNSWPTRENPCLPPGTCPYSGRVQEVIERRKATLRAALANPGLVHFPRAEVKSVLDYWKVSL